MATVATALVVLAAVGVVWFVLRLSRGVSDHVLDGLGTARSLLEEGAVLDEGEKTVTGTLDGHKVKISLLLGPTSYADERVHATQIDVLRGEPPFTLELRPQTPREQDLKQRGLAVDATVGDPAFDDAFVIEAAPVSAARALLRNKNLRARLLALHPASVLPCPGGIRLVAYTWLVDRAEIRRALQTAVALATAMDAAALTAQEGPREIALAAPTYRAASASARRGADARLQEEIVALAALKEKRRQHLARRARLASFTVAALFLALVLVRLLLKR